MRAQTLTWDAEGHLGSVRDTATGRTADYVYDADGSRLVAHQGDGSSTLFVGSTEINKSAAGVVSGSRSYLADGEVVAVRDSAGIDMVSVDHHGTPVLAVDGATAGVTKRRFSAFGEEFGAPAWPSSREFLNKVADASGYVHVEAREYDSSLGRFLSVDPIADFTDSQQINGYAYANNNPVTYSDPSGLHHQDVSLTCASFTACGPGAGHIANDPGGAACGAPPMRYSCGSGGAGSGAGRSVFPGVPSSATRPDWMNDFLAKGIAARQAQAQRFDSTKKKVTKKRNWIHEFLASQTEEDAILGNSVQAGALVAKSKANTLRNARHVKPGYAADFAGAARVLGGTAAFLQFGVAADEQYTVSRGAGDSEVESTVKGATTGTLAAGVGYGGAMIAAVAASWWCGGCGGLAVGVVALVGGAVGGFGGERLGREVGSLW